MAVYPVVEIFTSINGEGRRAGQLAVFLRMKGCNLSCSYCDTIWANKSECPSHPMNELELKSYVAESGINNVTLTGGEPLLQPELNRLFSALLSIPGIFIEIETNGSVYFGDYKQSFPSLSFTMDYKLPDSGMESYMNLNNLDALQQNDTVKFVAGSMTDLKKAHDIITAHRLTERCSVYISPVFGRIQPDSIVSFMREQKLNHVNLQLQLHKFIWEPDKKGV